jgi:membrane-associated protease RseP (regulator of RpoE activity)
MSTTNPPEPRPPEQPPIVPQDPPSAEESFTSEMVTPANPGTRTATPDIHGKSSGADASRPSAALPELRSSHLRSAQRRRVMLPILLFVATCLSTFWVGAANWRPQTMESAERMQIQVANNWRQGLTYMGAVLAILLTHEMGHFLQTVRYRIPASYPLCIPVPFSIIGTMGAVISMDGMRANRKQIFDIGIAGPLAGLVVAAPILYIGVKQLDLSDPPVPHDIQLYNPVIVRWMIEWMHPQWDNQASWVSISQLNPYFMAGWVGMLITGLNMLPVSQLDGGHTIYALFGRESYKLVRAFVIVAIVYVVLNLDQAAIWTPMLILVILLGIHHPPTADDSVELDDFRWILGVASMAIPVLCFPLQALKQ